MREDKLANLMDIVKDMNHALLAFSGGADSTFLLKVMHVSGIRALAITMSSEIIPLSEVSAAKEIAKEIGAEHRVLEMGPPTEDFLNNPPERCYFCKAELFRRLREVAVSEGIEFLLEGSNRDDLTDFRPGRKAASEYHVRSPLIEAGFTKSEVREFSKRLGLPAWDKPSSGCLATRIPYGRRITTEALKRIERSEDLIRSLGFRQVRVRDHGRLARIEIEEDEMGPILRPEIRKNILETLRSLGYKFISLDLGGYKSGMNRVSDDDHGL